MQDNQQINRQKLLDKQLHEAVLEMDIQGASLLLNEGAKINARNKDNKTPLHAILSVKGLDARDRVMMANFLIDNGADINQSDNHGTPVYYAAMMADYSHTKFMDALAQRNPEMKLSTREDTVYFHALVEKLLDSGADLGIKGTPQHLSALQIIQNSHDDELQNIHSRYKDKKNKEKITSQWRKDMLNQKNSDKSETAKTAKEGDEMSKFITVLPNEKPEDVMKEIQAMIGHDAFKQEAQRLFFRAQFNKACAEHGVPTIDKSYHLALTGNPGTGKTMEARLRARLLHSLDIAGNKYAEVTREKLMDNVIGGTDMKIRSLIEQSDQMFFDEAYSLSNDDSKRDFGHRVVEALIPSLENERANKVFMFAGYTADMDRFLSSNAGLNSRVKKRHVEDYTQDQLDALLKLNLNTAGRNMTDEVRSYAMEQVLTVKSVLGEREFGNARVIRDLVEDIPDIMAQRLFGLSDAFNKPVDKEALTTVTRDDIDALDLVSKMAGSRVAAKKEEIKKSVGFKPVLVTAG